jgi:hypothetical protein
MYVIEAVVSVGTNGVGISVLTLVFILAYINAVRGAFAYHKYGKPKLLSLPAPCLWDEGAPVCNWLRKSLFGRESSGGAFYVLGGDGEFGLHYKSARGAGEGVVRVSGPRAGCSA